MRMALRVHGGKKGLEFLYLADPIDEYGVQQSHGVFLWQKFYKYVFWSITVLHPESSTEAGTSESFWRLSSAPW